MWFSRRNSVPARRAFHVPAGQRVYAIGDIHGRFDLLEALLARIDADNSARGPADTQLIFLGDLIDRGPDSARVVERVRGLCELANVRCLKGNHEETLVRAARGHTASARGLLLMGGVRTLLSYGISRPEMTDGSFYDLSQLITARVPPEDLAFLTAGEELIEIGGYAFVHAGIRPGVPLAEQTGQDLRWIRGDFLESPDSHPAMIVHGHTITENVDERDNRIGIDTGAFMSGRLTAIGLEGADRWYLEAAGTPDPDWDLA